MNPLDELLRALGLLAAAGGGVVAIAYALFKKFGEKWLDAKFEQNLTNYKHAQQKELERLRFSINSLLNRASKLADREFDSLPSLWATLNDAFWRVSALTSPFQSYPDLERMTNTQLAEFLSHSDLNDWEKDELRASRTKNDYYIERIFWHKLTEARRLARELSISLAKQGIFLTKELQSEFAAIEKMLWDALSESEMNQQYKVVPRETKSQDALRKEGEPTLNRLKQLVHARLWDAHENAP